MRVTQITGGSTSVRLTGRYGMRRAGAAARNVLIRAAADRWSVEPGECESAAGFVIHPDGKTRLGYGDLASDAALLTADDSPELKDPSQYTLVGQSIPRVDLPPKIDGTAVYGIDADLPDLRYAALYPVPQFAGTIRRVDATRALAAPGVEYVIELEEGVAVVADRYWRAKKALALLDVEFDKGPKGSISSDSLRASQTEALESERFEVQHETGDVLEPDQAVGQTIEAEYFVPFLAHATMEPMNGTAWFHDGQCEVWSGVQNALGARQRLAKQAEVEIDDLLLHPVLLGGGFGRRGTGTLDYALQTVEIAKQVPYPVKLVWTREQDIQHDAYRPAVLSRMRTQLASNGDCLAWQHDFFGSHDPAEASLIPYSVPHQRIRYVDESDPIPFGPWRSVDHTQHSFFIESLIDEAAHAAGRDPLEYRLDHLAQSKRHHRLLTRLREQTDWDRPLKKGFGRGIAVVESFGSVVAQLVELEAGDDWLRVDRVVSAVDTGEVVHPDSLRGQIEGAVLFGLSAALYGEITIRDGAVVESNFPDYEMVRMGNAPDIETILEPSGADIGGAGEIGTPPLAPALANALFQATGRRIRELPFRKAGFRVMPRRA